MDDLQSIVDEQDQELNDAGSKFKKKSKRILHAVEVSLLLWLVPKLTWRNGQIAATAANARLLSAAADQFSRLLVQSNYPEAVGELVTELNKQPAFFERIVKASGVKPLDPLKSEAALRDAKRDEIVERLITRPVDALRSKLFISGSSLLQATQTDLVSLVNDALGTTPGSLSTEAMTAISTYYRGLAEREYARIQAQQSELLRFRYVGPSASDPVIRPFCRHLMLQVAAGKTWTRAEIDDMDNGQITNVFVSCGGFNCRHQWVISH